MKVAVLLPEIEPFSPNAGAIARVAFEIGQHSEHDITIFSPFSRSEYRTKSTICHLYIPVLGRIPRVGRLFRWLYEIEAAFRIKMHGNFPVICVHNRPALIAKIKKLNPESKFVLHMHNDHLRNLDQSSFLKAMNATDLLISCCHYLSNGIIDKDPTFRTKSCVLHNGVNLQEFVPFSQRVAQESSPSPTDSPRQSPSSARVLYVGRLSEEKGVHLLIEAMKKVLREIPEAKLVIVGSHWFGATQETPLH